MLDQERIRPASGYARLHNVQSDISCVDFSDPTSIGEYAAALCQRAERTKMFAPDFTPTAESNSLRHTARQFTRQLEALLPQLSPAFSLPLLAPYDLVHRLAYGVAADHRLIDRLILRAFNALIGGDTAVDQYILYREIEQRVRNHSSAFFGKPLKWLSVTVERWYDDFIDIATDTLSDYDILSRLSILLRSDLTALEGNHAEAFKRDLLNQYRPLLDKYRPLIDRYFHLLDRNSKTPDSDSHTLYAAEQLLYSATPYLKDNM